MIFPRNLLKPVLKSGCRFNSTLVLAEHSDNCLSKITLNAITAANKLGSDISVLVAGSDVKKVAEEVSKINGVKKVLVADDPKLKNLLPEPVADVIVAAHKQNNYSSILAGASSFSRGVIPRVGGILDISPISEITEVHSGDTFTRPMYAGNAMAKVKSKASVKLITVRGAAFEAAPNTGGSGVVEDAPKAEIKDHGTTFVSKEIVKSDRPELTSAKIVVSGGRGFKSKENFELVYKFADALNAGVGASRAAVDAGFCPNDLQVGQTGKIVNPNLYICCGISGAIQHVAGMKDSKVIVAINTDKEAPIFQIADYGLVADVFKAVPEFIDEVKKTK
ncbi:Electron transfer flavoprotein subunit alpha, mitochondrial [Strongyloides ratti]|uniref:Electron transfer flavoprotein subunit alpha n=1 Tax=Strongyloides ratti TaxID=34506 RepID=A0A090LKH4_STRRB|nr:Electron transfer flavoprotein subunit alpha, mitochondrial [Strongyloides ratti]CEF68060.1 Electron transfer flavoprotein subunit alpha, mitochondrial [Strongyloides ratti]